jgi:carbonic anhydrase
MAAELEKLFDNNRRWSEDIRRNNPEFFPTLSRQQAPEYLWIGCSDSRVPANEIVGLLPGELFVHRNVANVINHTDLNALSVMQFAVDILRVRHIMVVGHYGCGGVHCALDDRRLGLSDNWLRHVQDVKFKHADLLGDLPPGQRGDALCELNVLEQVMNAMRTTVLQDAWARGQALTVHGWVYGLADGLVRDLGLSISSAPDGLEQFSQAMLGVQARREPPPVA